MVESTKTRVLITGGAGFIGSNLALKLYQLGYEVVVLDNLSQQIHGDDPFSSSLYLSIKDKVTFYHGSVLNQSDWIKSLKGVDVVVHLAAETGTGQSMYQIERYTDTNVKGSAILLDLLTNKEVTVSKLIVASSRSIYGEGKYSCEKHGFIYPSQRNAEDMASGYFEVKCPICSSSVTLHPTCESSKIHPSSIYGLTKFVQEEMFLITGKTLNIPTVALRFQNVYGPGQSLSNPYTGILSIFSTRIKNNNSINVFEDGLESRDFVFIDDVVQSIVLSIENNQLTYNVFNIGSGVATSVLSVANSLKDCYSSSVEINITGNFRVGDIRHNYADLSSAFNLLGFEPKIDFSKGIKLFCKWVESQDIKKDLYENSIEEMRSKGLYK